MIHNETCVVLLKKPFHVSQGIIGHTGWKIKWNLKKRFFNTQRWELIYPMAHEVKHARHHIIYAKRNQTDFKLTVKWTCYALFGHVCRSIHVRLRCTHAIMHHPISWLAKWYDRRWFIEKQSEFDDDEMKTIKRDHFLSKRFLRGVIKIYIVYCISIIIIVIIIIMYRFGHIKKGEISTAWQDQCHATVFMNMIISFLNTVLSAASRQVRVV